LSWAGPRWRSSQACSEWRSCGADSGQRSSWAGLWPRSRRVNSGQRSSQVILNLKRRQQNLLYLTLWLGSCIEFLTKITITVLDRKKGEERVRDKLKRS